MQKRTARASGYQRSHRGNIVEERKTLDAAKRADTERRLEELPQGTIKTNLTGQNEPDFKFKNRFKTTLRNAYLTMDRSQALAKHPELTELYELEAAAQELASRRIGNPDSRKAYVTAIRERSLDELSNGRRLPQIVQGQGAGRHAAMSAEGQLDAER